MKIQQIRNATLKIIYDGVTFLLDPWLQDKGTGFSAPTIIPEMQGVKSPLNDLPFSPEEILKDVDYCLVTHYHPDHFKPDYLPKDVKIIVANNTDKEKIEKFGMIDVSLFDDKKITDELVGIHLTKTPAIHGDNEEIALEMGESSGYKKISLNTHGLGRVDESVSFFAFSV